ncbi:MULTISPECIES: aminoacyl-tRNA hydrolase [Leptolyngbya]|uniref:Peptidyl-tRNA hydrolase n=1 Tax=Leptolyngbya boryana CZ1 TaxID=3060204 RepID=A0AA96WZN7_LEPBY|nr:MULTISPECIES: aminoacyl-tRNA hydrolase [Leptolyngbya]MBN8559109.1 aminoacyl-tRNA hydrolase [Leptolyngbya sp. UWPOB_LEPTO1]MCY6489103.1 aminoacyl-tRNA hydrolase [Leptolyngbya sp. GGD]WNZ48272.1 aminoacyl-tRNA hydrolase [Leptolyngbya boryana CZ1]
MSSEATSPQLIVGLGNPGSKYENTRHNVGFLAIDRLAKLWQIGLSEHKKFQGWFGEGMSPVGKIRLLKPTTYMNNSGQAIRAVVDWYKIPPEAVMVIYDDMDLPVGRLRLRLSGSAGGQNGMKSAIAHLGTQKFPRLRIGIGSAKSNEKDAVSHVLGTFAPNEKGAIDEVLNLTVSAVELSLKQGVEKAMSLYNNQSVESKSAS